jgi:hypothetical protein
MSYREDNDQVILTMDRGDYERLLILLGTAAVGFGPVLRWLNVGKLSDVLALLNRLNDGNPEYKPYQIQAEQHVCKPSCHNPCMILEDQAEQVAVQTAWGQLA